ncbi:MAG: polymorphic toxin-type HINT domain-containing protein [Planctomycetota bacterium]
MDMLISGPMGRWAAKLIGKMGLGKLCPLLGKLACQVLQIGAGVGISMAVRSQIMGALFDNCFVAGTPVLMADGSTKPIEDIEIGDEVLTRDENDPEGETTVGVVVKLFRNVSHDGLLTIEWSDPADTAEAARAVTTGSHSVTTTPGHEWYVIERGWILAKDIRNGDVLVTTDGRVVVVRRVRCGSPKVVSTYNLEVARTHTYNVGETGSAVWVHNFSIRDMGAEGEAHVMKILQSRGFTNVIAIQNPSTHGVDIFAEKNGKLWAIEVKTSMRGNYRLTAAQRNSATFVESRINRLQTPTRPIGGETSTRLFACEPSKFRRV